MTPYENAQGQGRDKARVPDSSDRDVYSTVLCCTILYTVKVLQFRSCHKSSSFGGETDLKPKRHELRTTIQPRRKSFQSTFLLSNYNTNTRRHSHQLDHLLNLDPASSGHLRSSWTLDFGRNFGLAFLQSTHPSLRSLQCR